MLRVVVHMMGCRVAVQLHLEVVEVHQAGWEESEGTLPALLGRELEGKTPQCIPYMMEAGHWAAVSPRVAPPDSPEPRLDARMVSAEAAACWLHCLLPLFVFGCVVFYNTCSTSSKGPHSRW